VPAITSWLSAVCDRASDLQHACTRAPTVRTASSRRRAAFSASASARTRRSTSAHRDARCWPWRSICRTQQQPSLARRRPAGALSASGLRFPRLRRAATSTCRSMRSSSGPEMLAAIGAPAQLYICSGRPVNEMTATDTDSFAATSWNRAGYSAAARREITMWPDSIGSRSTRAPANRTRAIVEEQHSVVRERDLAGRGRRLRRRGPLPRPYGADCERRCRHSSTRKPRPARERTAAARALNPLSSAQDSGRRSRACSCPVPGGPIKQQAVTARRRNLQRAAARCCPRTSARSTTLFATPGQAQPRPQWPHAARVTSDVHQMGRAKHSP